MKFRLALLSLMLLVLTSLLILCCGDGGTTGGGAGDETDADADADDDDEAENETSDCETTIYNVYNCGHYFINSSGTVQAAEEAYAECLALVDSSTLWTCRINCATGGLSCNMLYQCLLLCPADGDSSAETSE